MFNCGVLNQVLLERNRFESANYISLAVSKLRANASNRTCIPCKTDEIPKIFSRWCAQNTGGYWVYSEEQEHSLFL